MGTSHLCDAPLTKTTSARGVDTQILVTAHVARVAMPSDVLAVEARWTGSGRYVAISCTLTDTVPLTVAQQATCQTAMRALVSTVRRG